MHAQAGPRRPRVFVSYTHDDPSHKANVLAFCEFLVQSGVDVRLDQWNTSERRDWQLWATAEILNADFVIVVASPLCRLIGDGAVDHTTHRGMQSEMRTLRELYHSDPATWQRKMLPAVLPAYSVTDIPLFLRPWTADHYVVSSLDPQGAEDLLRALTGQAARKRPSLGPLTPYPPADQRGPTE
jgi:hypothetical protein